MVGPLRDDFNLRRRQVGIGVHGHPLKRQDSADRNESGQHQHEEFLTQRRLDDSVNHSVVVLPTPARVVVSLSSLLVEGSASPPVLPLALKRIRKLEEQAAIPNHLVSSLQTAC